MVAERKADEWRIVFDVVEVVMATEIAGATHNVFVGEGLTEEMRIELVDVEGEGGGRFLVD
jgi:hypothetical protein